MGSAAQPGATKMEALAIDEQGMGLPLQDSLGPELLKLLDDLGGEDGWCGGSQAAMGAALDTTDTGKADVFMEDAMGIPMPQDPHDTMKTEQYKSSSGHCMLPPSAYRTPFLNEDYTSSYAELSPPQSAFQQPAPPQTPPSSGPRPLTQKPRSIRRARSGLPAHLQSRSSSEPQEVLRRANSGSELQEAKKQASRQVLSGSPRSTSTIFRPFSPLAAVEVFPEEAAMAANGRRIKRRGSERSDELEVSPPRALQASAEGSEHVSQMLESQKRAYEAKLENSGTRVSDLGRQLVRLQMEKQVLEQTLQQVLEQPLTHSSPTTSQKSQKSDDDKNPNKEQVPAKEAPKLFNPAMEYDPNCVLLVSLQDKPLTLTAQQVTCLPWLQYVRLIKQYITSIGALLPEAEAQPKSAAAQRAEQLGREAMYIGSCLAAGVPRHVRTLHCLKLHEGGPEHSRAPPQLWTAITFQMSLSAEQRQELLRRRRAFVMAMAELLRRRRAIRDAMMAVPHPDPTLGGISNSWLRMFDLMERMRNNLEKDHSLVRRFTGGVVHQVWTPLQYARALVQSFPWMPDPLSIANCVAEQAKEPSAEELLSGRTSSLASTSTTSIPSHLSNGSHTGQPGRPGHSASQPMLHDMSARMSWLQSGQAGGQPSGQLGQAFRQAKLLQLGRQSPPKPAQPVSGLPMAAPTTSQPAPCPASSAPQM